MKKRIVLIIEENEMNALEALAKIEFRTAWQQAAIIIRMELQRRGLIKQPAPAVTVEDIRPSTGKDINDTVADDQQE